VKGAGSGTAGACHKLGQRNWVLSVLASLICLASLTACASLSPLHDAAYRGDTKQVLELIAKEKSVNPQNIAGQTPLHLAAYGGHLDTVRSLLDRGATIDARDSSGETPLHYAAGAGRLDVVRLLVERGADVTVKAQSSVFAAPESAAQKAESQGHSDVARYLREAETRSAQGKTPVAGSAASSPSATTPAKPAESPPPIY